MVKFAIGLVLLVAVVGFFLMRDASAPTQTSMMNEMKDAGQTVVNQTEKTLTEAIKPATDRMPETTVAAKEFSMTSYYDDQGVWFSLKEMRVKKGDVVRVKVTNTKGMHDFVIDEFGIKKETPLNQEVVIEFVAAQAGTFEYYCSKPGHRAKGQWGKLIVE